MADIKVSIPDLEMFKETVDKNSNVFDEIKQNLSSHLAQLRQEEWETEGAREFDTVFKKSEGDIAKLVDTMRQFVAYLNSKIQQAWDIDRHKC